MGWNVKLHLFFQNEFVCILGKRDIHLKMRKSSRGKRRCFNYFPEISLKEKNVQFEMRN